MGLATLVLAVALGAANLVGTSMQGQAGYAGTAQFDGQRYGGPSIRFSLATDQSIAYDLDYGVGWRPSGNLGGANLRPGEQITAVYVDHYLYVFVIERASGASYWKRCDPDAGIDRWSAEWQRWGP
jgi:hypothetical protein